MLRFIEGVAARRFSSSAVGRLHAWGIGWRLKLYRRHIVQHTYGTRDLHVCLTDPLSQYWYDRDWSELPEITVLRRSRLRPGARVFDLGAHHGVVAMMLAHEVGPTGQIVAVEPNPHNAASARTNRDLNNMPQIEIVEVAVSARVGTVVFNRELNGQLDDGAGAKGQVLVDSLTVDRLSEQFGAPHVVFMDVEGAECDVLTGAEHTLKSATDFFVEVHVDCGLERLGGSVDRVLSFFPPDRFLVLGRADQDTSFHRLTSRDTVFGSRFFLVALSRAARRAQRHLARL